MSNIVPTDSDSIFRGLDSLTTLERNAIVRPNNPPPGIAGFVFDINVEDSVDIQSDITDHYVENNTAIQDQIALRPEVITVRGLVGELIQASEQVDAVQKALDSLPVNETLTPEYTEEQLAQLQEEQLLEEIEVEALVDDKSLDGYFKARTPQTGDRQSRVFAYFYNLWKGRQLFTVDTPWGFFTDMAIQSLRVNQDSTTKYVSDFIITFKKIRFAENVIISSGQLAGRVAQQSAEQTNNGVAGKEPVTEQKNQSLLYWLIKRFLGP